jgi:hypothetical protein
MNEEVSAEDLGISRRQLCHYDDSSYHEDQPRLSRKRSPNNKRWDSDRDGKSWT